jgi:hypothetical protein
VRVTLPDSIDPDQVKVAAIAAMAGLGVITFVIGAIISKIVVRVVLLGLFAAGALFLYGQRDDLDRCQEQVRASMTATSADVRCTCTFVGIDVTVPRCPPGRAPGG